MEETPSTIHAVSLGMVYNLYFPLGEKWHSRHLILAQLYRRHFYQSRKRFSHFSDTKRSAMVPTGTRGDKIAKLPMQVQMAVGNSLSCKHNDFSISQETEYSSPLCHRLCTDGNTFLLHRNVLERTPAQGNLQFD